MNKMSYDFNQLFILDLANNHQGDLDHGLKIIDGCSSVANKFKVKAGIKFQFRQLDSFIHPDFKNADDIKHIKRFTGTRLEIGAYKTMVERVAQHGLISICTPFDEESVKLICDLDIDIIKIASCSAQDWPLLECVVKANKPIIISTAGLSIKKIDYLVSFLKSHKADFAVMHCVAIYPTPEADLQLNMLSHLRDRYVGVPIGFSTHEDPDNLSAIQIAYAKGAQLFERHVGLNTDEYKLNGYSSTPEQLTAWIQSYVSAVAMCGSKNPRPTSILEKESLHSLKRGVYLKENVSRGEAISRDKVFFAMPAQDGQLLSEQFVNDIVADRDYVKNEAFLGINKFEPRKSSKQDLVFDIILQVRGLLNNARVNVSADSSLEISHHYGLERFREFGCVIINCINREYCKKLIILLPRQKHPYHMHKRKEETFQLLYGDLELELNGDRQQMSLGDTALIKMGDWHKFHTLDGAIFEEISTTHYDNDSFYEDDDISCIERSKRKTYISNWSTLDMSHWKFSPNKASEESENAVFEENTAEIS